MLAGLLSRATATPIQHKALRKEHGWDLVSKSLTLLSAPPKVEVILMI